MGHRILITISLAGTLAGSPSPDVVLARMREAQSNVTSLVARLEQVKSYPQLGIDDPVERGHFTMSREQDGHTRARIEIREPDVRILVVSDGNYLLYQPRIRQAVEGKVRGGGTKNLFSGILLGSSEAMAELERNYRVESLGTQNLDAREVTELRFTAAPGAAVYCQRIDLWVETASWLPVRQSCHEANESVITFTLEDVKVNVPIAKDAFDVELPPKVEKIRG